MSRRITRLLLLIVLWPAALPAQRADVTGILGALDIEVRLLEQQLTDTRKHVIEGIPFTEGRLGRRHVVVAQVGVGKVNAAITTTLLIEHFRPRQVIFTGVAGALAPELRVGDIVIAHRTAHHDLGTLTNDTMMHWGARIVGDTARNPVFFPADTVLHRIALAVAPRVALAPPSAGEPLPRVVTGTVVTGDVFMSSSVVKDRLRGALDADAVEMEGAAVAQVCWQLGRVPVIIIRSISDAADEGARLSFEKFKIVAADNSARLVRAVVDELAARTPPSH